MRKAFNVAACWALCLLVASGALADSREILFLAGPRDHGGPGRHEYELDLRTLAQSIESAKNLPGVKTRVIVGNVSAIVIESSSDRLANETHPLFPQNPSTNYRGYDAETIAYLKALDELIAQNRIGIVLLHYATWAENVRAREYYLKWTGGLWVQGASKNPVDDWSMKPLARHPILSGVKPWTYRDEVFCRFLLPDDRRRTNLILATPSEDKLDIGPQVASFAYQRADGGRGFVFGGLDFRDNLALDNYRRFLLNGIAWAAHLEIPKGGIQSPTPDVSKVSPAAPRPPP
jgi:type 1 glutamine amidotransferase